NPDRLIVAVTIRRVSGNFLGAIEMMAPPQQRRFVILFQRNTLTAMCWVAALKANSCAGPRGRVRSRPRIRYLSVDLSRLEFGALPDLLGIKGRHIADVVCCIMSSTSTRILPCLH